MATLLPWLDLALLLYVWLLFGRLIISIVFRMSPNARPTGVGLVFLETVMTLTDPPVKFFRRLLPNVRIFGVELDLSLAASILAVSLLRQVLYLVPV